MDIRSIIDINEDEVPPRKRSRGSWGNSSAIWSPSGDDRGVVGVVSNTHGNHSPDGTRQAGRRQSSMGIGSMLNSAPSPFEKHISGVGSQGPEAVGLESEGAITVSKASSSLRENHNHSHTSISISPKALNIRTPHDSNMPSFRNALPNVPERHTGRSPVHTRIQKLAKPPRSAIPIFARSVRNNTDHQPPCREATQSLQLEPNLLNQIPADEIIKVISDFLYLQVMQNQNLGDGAVLEIEAKMGRIMDKSTMDRLRVPVLTETVFDRNNPNHRTHFESSMTETQHRFLNGFLNKALIATQDAKPTPQNPDPPRNQRARMVHGHTKEVDTFYDLSQHGLLALPSSLNISPRSSNKVKVRITHDQKTGRELAKIVKSRLADVDVHSPNNQVDWRISVNIEKNFQGDMKDLIETGGEARRGERHKDRMSYKHQAYQIDLTQVTPADATPTSHKEHELEIEVSEEEVRRQATLLEKGEPNQFVELISSFVNNIRTLARQVPPD